MSIQPIAWLPLLPETRGDRIRLLGVAILLPALFVVANVAALRAVEYYRSLASVWYFFALLLGEIGLLGWAAGTLVQHPVWRWLVFGWVIVLVDLLVYSTPDTSGWYQSPPHLRYAMISGQAGMLLVWGVLARTAWTWRLPAAAVAIALTTLASPRTDYYGDNSVLLLWCQSAATAMIAVLLRWFGFGLEKSGQIEAAQELEVQRHKPLQYSLLNLIVWMTAAAPVLAIIRLADWAIVDYFHYGNGWVRNGTLGVIMTMLSTAALWAALGNGARWLRFAVLMALIPAVGIVACFVSVGMLNSIRAPGISIWNLVRGEDVSGWVAWACLSAFFLAATLLIFRASGYRLQRRRA